MTCFLGASSSELESELEAGFFACGGSAEGSEGAALYRGRKGARSEIKSENGLEQ